MSEEAKRPQETEDSDAPPTKIFAGDQGPKTMEMLRNDQRYCDAVIEAGGERFKIHKCVLGIHSDFFDKAFTVEMREKYDKVVKVEGVSAQVMKSIVDFLYSVEITTTPDNVVEIFLAADFLMIECLKTQCEKTMIECLDEQNYIERWRFAKKFNLSELSDQSLTFVAEHLKSISERETFILLSFQEVEEIVRFCSDKEISQETVCTAILTWVKHDVRNREENIETLFGILDCSKFSKDFLKIVAQDEPLVRRSPTSLVSVVDELFTRYDTLNTRIDRLSEEKRNITLMNNADKRRCNELESEVTRLGAENLKEYFEKRVLQTKLQNAMQEARCAANLLRNVKKLYDYEKEPIHDHLCEINASLRTRSYY